MTALQAFLALHACSTTTAAASGFQELLPPALRLWDLRTSCRHCHSALARLYGFMGCAMLPCLCLYVLFVASASAAWSTQRASIVAHQQTTAAAVTDKNSTTPSPTSPTSPLMRVSFVNGIYHTEEEWRNLTQSLSQVFEDQVRAFYNPSSGTAFFNWVQDAARAGYELVRRPNDLDLAKRLAEHLRRVLQEVGPSGRVLHLAHSGGAILTYLAAKYHLTSQETDRIDLATFGGGRSITRKYFKGRIVNYYSRNDPLTLVDGRAGALMKHALSRAAVGGGKGQQQLQLQSHEVRDRKYNTTFVFLPGIADNPLIDHSMFGPTYERALRIEAANFRQRLSKMTAAVTVAEARWLRKLRKSVAKTTGLHHFWGNSAANVQAYVRVVRKQSAKITKKRGYFSKKTLIAAATNISADTAAGFPSTSSSSYSSSSSSSSSATSASTFKMAMMKRLGRFYPSVLLPTISSSDPLIENEGGDDVSTATATGGDRSRGVARGSFNLSSASEYLSSRLRAYPSRAKNLTETARTSVSQRVAKSKASLSQLLQRIRPLKQEAVVAGGQLNEAATEAVQEAATEAVQGAASEPVQEAAPEAVQEAAPIAPPPPPSVPAPAPKAAEAEASSTSPNTNAQVVDDEAQTL
jgi:histone arginine demethylase JMJD6